MEDNISDSSIVLQMIAIFPDGGQLLKTSFVSLEVLKSMYDCSVRDVFDTHAKLAARLVADKFIKDFGVKESKKREILESHKISETVGKFMVRFGWEFPGNNRPAIKYELISGKVLAHEGDETWARDLKVAGE